MSGETSLEKLLKNINPDLKDGVYVFCTVRPAELEGLEVTPVGRFVEDEGVTLILSKSEAEKKKLAYSFPARMITLNVHSSLEAVGFLAAVTTELASAGISVNAISAFYHDHLFVPVDRANEAMKILEEFRMV